MVQQLNTKEGLDILVVVPQMKSTKERRVELLGLVFVVKMFPKETVQSFSRFRYQHPTQYAPINLSKVHIWVDVAWICSVGYILNFLSHCVPPFFLPLLLEQH